MRAPFGLAALAALLLATAACAPRTETPPMPASANGLVVVELAPGSGATVAKGQTAVVHYTGWLYLDGAPDAKGAKFDSSHDRAQPFSFQVGAGQVIGGWDQGVAGMQVGGKRRLVIPPELGYGSRGAGGVIPPGATLVFDVELVGVQ
jgi:FKBP-type peptidyl-prolyl cis-trans isomerase